MEAVLEPEQAIDQFRSRLGPMDCLVVAVSGGGDSTALLQLLHEERINLPRLVVVTVDHGLRSESAREAESVAKLCGDLGIEHDILRWTGRKPLGGIQEAARLARYDLIRQCALSHGAGAVVTGHTRDDQIETAIMRGERGSGRGLAGMAEAVLYQGDCWILRPLLAVRRDSLRAHLNRAGIGWIEDPGNRDTRFERARLRQSTAVPADGEVLAMIATAAAARRDEAAGLARFVDMHARLHGGIIVEIPQVPEAFSEYQQQAIALFATLMGGRSHLPGAQQRTRIARFAADIGPPRVNVAGSIIDRRADRLFVYRERRGQSRRELAPGECLVWDGRYRICNKDDRRNFVMAPARSDIPATGLWRHDPDWSAGVPPGVVSRARASEPTVFVETEAGLCPLECLPQSLTVQRYLAVFDLFLPDFDLTVANSCAELFGRAGYPVNPLEGA